jgi:preprotein translocase subunit SecE
MKKYLKETKEELKKVNWPTRETVTLVTVAVLLISIVVGYLLGFFDFIFSKGLLFILNK